MEKKHSLHKILYFIEIIAAGISTLLGIVVLIGWYTHNITLIQVFPAFVPMQYNTALGFIICGIGLLGLVFNQRRLVMVLGTLVGALGFFTIMQYISGADFGIDQFFMKHYITVETSHPGRMAPNTALCFLFSGLALLIMNKVNKFKQYDLTAGILGSVIITLGAVSFFGYLSGVNTTYGWGNLTRMAVHAAMGFVTVGTGIFLLAWREGTAKDGMLYPKWIAIPVGIGVATIFVAICQAMMAQIDTNQSVTFPFIVLGTGLLMALLIMLIIRFAQKLWYRTTDPERLNKELEEQITERKRAEEEINKLAHALRSVNECVSITDNKDIIFFVNDAFLKTYGYTKDELIGKHISILRPKHVTLEIGNKILNKTIDGGWSGEIVNQKKDGTIFPVYLSTSVIKDDKENPIGLVGVATDITERKQVEEDLKKSEEKYRHIFNSIAEGIYRTRPDGQVILANPALVKMLGYDSAEELMSINIETGGYQINTDRQRFIELMEKDGQVREFEAKWRRKDGTELFVKENAYVVRDVEGNILYFDGTVEDITERKQAEETLESNLKQQRILTEVSYLFAKSGNFDENMKEVLRLIGEYSGVSRVYVFEDFNNGEYTKNIYEWCNKNIESQIDNLQEVPYKIIPSWKKFLIRKGMVLSNNILELPQDLIDILEPQKIKSIFILPIYIKNQFFGYIGFDECEKHRIWDNSEIELLKTVANIISTIFERRQAEEELRNSEERFRQIAESAGEWIWEIDTNGKYTYSSSVVENILGFTPDEIVGKKSFYDFFLPDVKADLKKAAFDIFSKKEVIKNLENPNVHKNGQIIILETSGVPIIDEKENLLGYRGADTDITKRKRAEEALKKSEEKYRNFFEEDLTGDYISTPDGRLLFCNQAFIQIFGFESMEEAMNCNLNSLYPDTETREAFLTELQIKKKLKLNEVELRNYQGEPIYVMENVIGNFNQNDELVEVQGYLLDLTENKKLEEQFRGAQKMEAIGQLAGGVAHDFNNLLTVIIGYSEILLNKLQDDNPIKKGIIQIRKAGEKAGSLTSQLLAFSRRQIIQPKVLNLNSIATDIEKMLHRLIGEDIKLVTMLNEELGNIKADKGQMDQVIMNLAVNARDAMPEGGNLTIETANVYLDKDYAEHHISVQPGAYVMLAISDTGIGMDSETKSRIFDPFFTTKENGTGLGLSTVYGIVKQSEGNIWVYSEPGKGTTIKIYLPQVEEKTAADAQLMPSIVSFKGSENILVVEDDSSVRELTCSFLKNYGYNVFEAVNGEKALQFCKKHKQSIHLIITDVVMPRMGGRVLFDNISTLYPEIKVLFMSGYTDNAIVHHGILDADVAFLSKPFSPDALALKVREVLDTSKLSKKD